MIVIYHNPGSPRSRECLEILETKKADYKVVKYMDEPLTSEKLGKVIRLLNLKPIDIVRKQERLWLENFESIKMSDTDLIDLLIEYPKLIERPIIINGDKAVIGKPPKKIIDII